jgi:hypothetical protein
LGFLEDAEGRAGADRFLVAVTFDCSPEAADGGRAVPLLAARGDGSSSCPPASLSPPDSVIVVTSGRFAIDTFASDGFLTAGLRCATRFLTGFEIAIETPLLAGRAVFSGESACCTGVGFGRGGRSGAGEDCPLLLSRGFGKGSSRLGGSQSFCVSLSSNWVISCESQRRWPALCPLRSGCRLGPERDGFETTLVG